jgi:SAM-dependent methyltransferase
MEPKELKAWFDHVRSALEDSYTAYPDSEPWRQSGMSGPESRWIALRKPLVDCLDHSGSFLDVGCANGYLLECLMRWSAERGLAIAPYGMDVSARLVDLARLRLPDITDQFFVDNSFDWTSPMHFDYVRTELVYVPADYERTYIERLIGDYLKPDGRLILASYMEGMEHPEQGLLPGSFPTNDILAHLGNLKVKPVSYRDGFDPSKKRKTRFAILTRESLIEGGPHARGIARANFIGKEQYYGQPLGDRHQYLGIIR